MTPSTRTPGVESLYAEQAENFRHWEKTKDIIDQCIDMTLNFRQSGHPGGSRSKVHAMLATLLGGVMRWDIRHPEKRFGDRFVLIAGHCTPLLYSVLAVLNQSLRIMHRKTGEPRYAIPGQEERALYWEDLLTFRRNGGLPGHAEMEGKTLFVKANTGPSGHGSPAAAGIAMALKRAGAGEVKVFAFEGEGGLTTGVTHETRNSAWGLGLDNLIYCVDWNDFGIDSRAASTVVHGGPREWFEAAGWRVVGVENGMDWPELTQGLLQAARGSNPHQRPSACYFRTRKGRGYGVYDAASHGTPHKANSELYWNGRQEFAGRYGVEFDGQGEAAPSSAPEFKKQVVANFKKVFEVMEKDEELVQYLADRLVEIGDSVPREISSFRVNGKRGNPMDDPELSDFENYPSEMFAEPGSSAPNRAALAKWGAWVNAWSHKKYGRPLFVVMSADLADSTNISGFAKGFGEFEGYGWYERDEHPEGVLLPQEITEFANSGIACGIASTNLAENPYEEWQGFMSGCSTYGSFSYLKYGPMRLFSQLAQDSQIKVGKVLWVAGHSGPETAEDSRTHFGIFSPYVTQLAPDHHIVDLHPWEHNEVPVAIAAGLRHGAAILALHLTRPKIDIPDREALGIPSHFEAARGAYVMRDYKPGKKYGVVIVSGTSTTANMVKILPELEKNGLNVKVVAAISPQLFRRESKRYQDSVISNGEWLDSMVVSNRGRRTMSDWVAHRITLEYSLTPDWDDRWRTGGSVDEIVDEAHLSPRWLLQGIERFVKEREERLKRIREQLQEAESS